MKQGHSTRLVTKLYGLDLSITCMVGLGLAHIIIKKEIKYC
jgi:hypothetical protein